MVGVVANTGKPVPVPVELPVPPLATARVPASVIAPDVADAGVSPVVPPANVVTPVVDVSNVAEDGIVGELIVPAVVFPDSVGVVRVGEVPRTTLPDPVEVVTPVPPLVTPSVPVTPVVSGRPVALVSVPDDGVPRAPPEVSKVELDGIVVPLMLVAVAAPRLGVVRLGEVERTTEPEPVEVVAPVPPPLTANGRPPILLMSVVTMQYQVPP